MRLIVAMAILGVIVILLIGGADPGESTDGPRIQVVQVPDRSLIEQIRALLPDANVTRTLGIESFRELVKRSREALAARSVRVPTTATLTARIDPKTGLADGTGVWGAPLGRGRQWRLSPWNLSAVDVTAASHGDLVWGLDSGEGLRVLEVSEGTQELEIRWRCKPALDGDNWAYSLAFPATSMGRLDLEIPEGRELICETATVALAEPGRCRLFLDKDGQIDFRIVPAGSVPREGEIAYRVQTECEVRPAHVDYRATVLLDVFRRDARSVTLELDSQLDPPNIACDLAGSWSKGPTSGNRTQWTLESDDLRVGRHTIQVSGRLPGCLEREWYPASLEVPGAVGGAESIAVWLDPSLSVTSLLPRGFDVRGAEVRPDGRYQFLFEGMSEGGARRSAFLEGDDFGDWRKLCAEVVRQVDEGIEGSAASLGRLIGPEGMTLARRVAAMGDVSPANQQRLLESLNRMLARADLAKEKPFSSLLPEDQDAITDDSLADASIARIDRNRELLELAFPDQILRRKVGGNRPLLRIDRTPGLVECSQRNLLDLSKRPFELVGRFEIVVLRGTLSQLQFQIPMNWRLGTVRVTPTERQGSVRTQPVEDGSLLVWVALGSESVAGDSLRVEIQTTYSQDVEASATRYSLELPELLLVDPAQTGSATYEIQLDSELTVDLDSLPPPSVPAETSRASENGRYVFSYIPPLASSRLSLSPPLPRFRSAVRHEFRRRADDWQNKIAIDLDVDVGEMDTVHVVTNAPLPEGIAWRFSGSGNSVARFELFPGMDVDEGMGDPVDEASRPSGVTQYNYLLETAAPIRDRVRLEANWTDSEGGVDVPLIGLPDADEFVGQVEVQSQTGRVVRITPVGLRASDPDRKSASGAFRGTIWRTQYDRLQGDVSLHLSVSGSEVEAVAGPGRAAIRCRSAVGPSQSVHSFAVRIDCRATSPLLFHLPPDAYVWRVELDGESLSPTIVDGVIEVTENLPAGTHDCLVVYSIETNHFWWLPKVGIHSPLPEWDVPCFLWTVEYPGAAYPWSGEGVFARASLRGVEFGPKSRTIVDLGKTRNTTRAMSALDQGFRRWLEAGEAVSLSEFLGQIGPTLPTGFLIVADREIAGMDPPAGSVAPTLEEWLRQNGLLLLVQDGAVFLTSRVASDLTVSPRPDWNWTQFTEDVGAEVARQGVDDGGEFVSPSAALQLPRPWRRDELSVSGRNDASIHLFAVRREVGPKSWSVSLVPGDFLDRVSRTLTVVFVCCVILFSRVREPKTHRQLLAILLICALVVAVAGGVWHHALSLPIWAAIGTVVVMLLRLAWTNPRVTGAAAAIFLALTVPTWSWSGEPVSHRVLVPTDEDGSVRRVIVPESLARELESSLRPRPSRLLLRRATYEGQALNDSLVRWHVVLEGAVELEPDDLVRLPFRDIVPTGLRIDGKSMAFRQSDKGGDIAFEIPSSWDEGLERGERVRPFRLDLDFEASLDQVGGRVTCSFGTPESAETKVLYSTNRPEVVVDGELIREGWSERESSEGRDLLWDGGPRDSIQVQYRTSEAFVGAKLADAEFVELLDVDPEGVQASATIRVASTGGSLTKLDLLMPMSFLVTSVVAKPDLESGGVGEVDWFVEAGDDGEAYRRVRVTVREAVGDSITLRLDGSLAGRPMGTWSVPWIAVEGAGSQRGVIGVRYPSGWTAEALRSTNVEPATPAAFAVAWSRLRRDVAPEGVTFVRRVVPPDADPSATLVVSVMPPKSMLRVRQSHEVSAYPETGALETTTVATFTVGTGSAPAMLSARVPEGSRVLRVAGTMVHDWYVEDGQLHLLPRAPIQGETVVRIVLSHAWQAAGQDPSGHLPVRVEPLEWLGARSGENRWLVRPPTGWSLDGFPSEPLNSSDGSVNLETAGSTCLFCSLVPLDPELRGTSVTLVTVREGVSTIEGRIELTNAGGLARGVDVRGPLGLTERSWNLQGMSPPTSRVVEKERVWHFPTQRAVSRDVVLRWQTSVLTGPERIVVPRVAVERGKSVKQWVIVANGTNQILSLEGEGLRGSSLPDSISNELGGEGLRSLRQVEVFETEGEDWQLSYSIDAGHEPGPSYEVHSSEADVLQTVDGSLRGVSRWDVTDLRDGLYVISTLPTVQIEDVFVDGLPLPLVDRSPTGVRFPVFRLGRRQEILVYWSSPKITAGESMALPQLTFGEDRPVVMRIRHPRELTWSVEGKSILRVEWLLRRLERLIGTLRDTSIGEDSAVDEARLSRIDQECRALERAIRTAGPEATEAVLGEVDRLREERERLMARSGVSESSVASPVATLETFAALEGCSGEVHSYFVADSAASSLGVQSHRFRLPRMRTTNEWVRISLATLSLVLVVVPRLWFAMRLYWPAPMLAAGVSWWLFADTAYVGLVLIVIAFVGVGLSLRRWFDGTTSEEVSSLLRRSTRIHRSFLRARTSG